MNTRSPRSPEEEGVNRRDFLKVATITAVAAAATGGGAAVLNTRRKPPVIVTDPAPAPVTASGFAAAPVAAAPAPLVAANADELLAQLASAQAENMQLRAQLDAVQRELTALQGYDAENRAARESLSLELGNAQHQLGLLGGLIALYQQLDDVDIGATVENGLAVLGGRIGELLGGAAGLAAGLDVGQTALAEVEAHIPLLENGRLWLDAQVAKMRNFHGEVERRLAEAVDRVSDFLQMLSEWFEGVRRWLPFRAGERAANVMNALTTLLAETPITLGGLDTNIAQPLDVWLARTDGEPALTRRLVKPIRDEVITRARTTTDQANTVGTTYEEQLAAPLRAALGNRAALRQAIAEYRAQNQL